MQLVILAGGLGKRLRPITLNRPKALVPLVGRPQIAYTFDSLPSTCEGVIISVNYLFDQVRDFFRENAFGVPVRVVDEPTPLGTAGAIRNVREYVHGRFAVYNGDVVDTIDFDRLVAAHEAGKGIATIALWPVENPSDFGVVAIERGRITRFVEKPSAGEAQSKLVNAGRYVFEPEVFDFIEAGRAVSLEREVFPRLVSHGLIPFRYEGFWSDGGTLSSYLQAQRLLLDSSRAKISPEADITAGVLRSPVHIGPGSFVEGRVGPHVVLGRSCRIGRASLANAALLDGVSIDDKAEVAGSIIGAGASIGEGAYVRDSILADQVQVAPHAKILEERVTA